MERGYLGRLQRWGLGSAGLRWRWRLTMASKLGLESHNLCCQLADVLFCGHARELAWGLQGLSFLLLSGCVQGQECTRCLGTCRALTYLQGVTQGEWIPAECLGRNVIACKLGYVHRGTLPGQK